MGTGGYGIRYEHNSRSSLAKVYWWNSTNAATYTYRPDGLRKKRTLDNGSATDYDYDAAGRPTLVYNYATANGATIEKQQYGYDLRDRRTWTRRNDDLGDTYAYQLDGQLTDFRFNASNPQATPSTWASRNTFTYDAAGNRTAVVNNGATVTYTPNSANQYSTITGVTIQHGDGRGNTTKLRDWTYAYDADNRMKTASRTGTSASFAYDPLGRLVKRTIAGVVEYLIYDGPQIVQRYDTTDTLQGWVVWGADPDEPLIDYTPTAGKHYYHSDVQGNTITVTDASLNTLERYRYDAYGNVTFWAWSGAQRPQSTAGTKYLFTGQEYVPALGLHNYKNRMYASEIGRFLQSDPKRLDGGDLNLYRYCRNNPFNRTDPLGLEETKGANGVTDEDVFGTRPEIVTEDMLIRSPGPEGSVFGTDPWTGKTAILKAAPGMSEGTADIAGLVLTPPFIKQILGALAGLWRSAGESAVPQGTKVFRVWGDEAGAWGRSWTTVDPRMVPDFRAAAGLPTQNSGRFVTEGILENTQGVTTRGALPLHGNAGGLPEMVIPNPATQVRPINVQGLNPEF